MAEQLRQSERQKEMKKTKSEETADTAEDKDESVETGYGSVSHSSESAATATASSESVIWTSEEHDVQQTKSQGITTRSQKKAKELMTKESAAQESKSKPKLQEKSKHPSPVKQLVNLGKRLTSGAHYRRLETASSVESETSPSGTYKSPDKLKSPKTKAAQSKVKSPRKQTAASGATRSPSASPKKKSTASASTRVKTPAKASKPTKSPLKKNDALPTLATVAKAKTGTEEKPRGSPEQKKSSVAASNPILKSLLLRGRTPEKEEGLPCSRPSGAEGSATKPVKQSKHKSPAKVASMSKTADVRKRSPAKQGATGKKADTQHIDTSLGTFLKDTLNINANTDDPEGQFIIDDMETDSASSGEEKPKLEDLLKEELSRTVWNPSNPNQEGGYLRHRGVEPNDDSSPDVEPSTESSKITDAVAIHGDEGAVMRSVSSDTQWQTSVLEEDPMEDGSAATESKEELEAKRQLKRMKEVLSSDSDEDEPVCGSPVKKANLPIVDDSGEAE